jgi:hypothetical protein
MTNRRLALGFGGWRAALAPRGDPMSKVLPYLSNRLVARALTAWLWTREELMAKRGAMRKSLEHLADPHPFGNPSSKLRGRPVFAKEERYHAWVWRCVLGCLKLAEATKDARHLAPLDPVTDRILGDTSGARNGLRRKLPLTMQAHYVLVFLHGIAAP